MGDPTKQNTLEIYPPGDSIVEMVNKMTKYVMPPQFDFIRNSKIEPFCMYLFEFDLTFDSKDLSHIWQGIRPTSLESGGKVARKQTSSVTHTMANNEFFGGEGVPSETRWMVFKVKQKAEWDYNSLMDKTLKSNPQAGEYPVEGARKLNFQIPSYSYNWPYDFFSFVELSKIEAVPTIGGDVPVVPIDLSSTPIPPGESPNLQPMPGLEQPFFPTTGAPPFMPTGGGAAPMIIGGGGRGMNMSKVGMGGPGGVAVFLASGFTADPATLGAGISPSQAGNWSATAGAAGSSGAPPAPPPNMGNGLPFNN